MSPTKRGLAACSESIPNRKKIKHAATCSSLVAAAAAVTSSPDNSDQLLQTSSAIISTGFAPKRILTAALNVRSLSAKENNTTTNAQTALPEDLEVEILARLPVQSLLLFKCVSKSWCALISSPTFIKRHLAQQKITKNTSGVLLIRRSFRRQRNKDIFSFHDPDSPNLDKLRPNLSIPFLKDFTTPSLSGEMIPYSPRWVVVLGPCNGLVCICYHDRFILCNPALREFKLLPEFPYAPPPLPTYYVQGQGFGVACNGEFKVVLIRTHKDKEVPCILVYVYNSRNNAWKKIDCDPAVALRNFYVPADHVFLNGACHWYALDHENYSVDFSDFVLSLDINTEVIRRLELPDRLKTAGIHRFHVSNGCRKLAIINERLAVIRGFTHKMKFELWVMREYGVEESWTKQHVIRNNIIKIPHLPWKNGEWLLSELSSGQLACFASNPCRMKGFKIYGAPQTFQALMYEESLISVDKLSVSDACGSWKDARRVLR